MTTLPFLLASFLLAGTATATPLGDEDPVLSRGPETNPLEEPTDASSPEAGALSFLGNADVDVKWGGRMFNDIGFFHGDDNYPGTKADGIEFRQARIWANIAIGEHLKGVAQFDFSGSATSFKDVYLKVPTRIGDLQVGHFKQPMGLEILGSSGATTFMEAGMVGATFAPSRDNGIMSSGALGEQTRWSLGVFKRTDNDSAKGQGDGEFTTTGRVTHTIGEGSHVTHLGLSASNWSGQDVQFSSRPEAHLMGAAADTNPSGGKVNADGVSIYAFEGAWIEGNLSVQGEYMIAALENFQGSDHVQLGGYYAFVSYFLDAADHRAYSQKSGGFSRVKPSTNWDGNGFGGGAKEVALRYSSMDFEAINGRTVDNVTLGFNWYLNPNARIMFNLLWSHVDQRATVGDLNEDFTAAMMRVQFRF